MKNNLILFMISLSTLFSCNTKQNDSITVLNANEFKEAIAAKNIQLVDVRTLKEYNTGHIKNAKNIDFFSSNFVDKFQNFNKEKPIYIYCRSGSRSKQSAKKLSALGFKKIYDLKGGYLNY
tara:strand:- start:3000 stop:3362 length:363 start_codon:yes stop_codon:yes gene_type:complete